MYTRTPRLISHPQRECTWSRTTVRALVVRAAYRSNGAFPNGCSVTHQRTAGSFWDSGISGFHGRRQRLAGTGKVDVILRNAGRENAGAVHVKIQRAGLRSCSPQISRPSRGFNRPGNTLLSHCGRNVLQVFAMSSPLLSLLLTMSHSRN